MAESPTSGISSSIDDLTSPAAEPAQPPSRDLAPGPAIWQPIPSFQTTEQGPSWAAPVPAGSSPAAYPAAAVYPAPALAARPRPTRLPLTPVSYAQLLRGPTRAWWRPVLSLLLLGGLFLLSFLVPAPVVIAYAVLSGETTVEGLGPWFDDVTSLEGPMGPSTYLYSFLALIVLIPAAMLSTWLVHRIRPGFLSSVAGRIRWGWLLRCLVVLAPLWVVYLGVSTLVDPPQSARPEQWAVLLVMGVLLTPGQAAAEEYVFRGWILQNLGSYFRRPVLSWVIPAAVAAVVFAFAHGSPDPWVLADLAGFSVTATLLTWRTGGLEAGIVMHTVNNIGITVVTTLIGGWDEAFVGEETRGTPMTLAVSLGLNAIAFALVWWQARRTGIDRLYRPPAGATAPAN